jgi:hypothetical protein
VSGRHTRRQLLAHLGQIQKEIGLALEYSQDDRNPDRAGSVRRALERAHSLCIAAAATDRPVHETEMRYLGFRIEDQGAPTLQTAAERRFKR